MKKSSPSHVIGIRVPGPILKIIDKAAALDKRTRANWITLAAAKAAEARVSEAQS